MQPTSTFAVLQTWREDCATLCDLNPHNALPDLGPDGHLTLIDPPPLLRWRLWDRVTALPDRPSLERNTAAWHEPIQRMEQASAVLCEQVGIRHRAITLAGENLARLTVRQLGGHLQQLLQSPGAQLVRVCEHLEDIVQLTRRQWLYNSDEAIEQLPGFLSESYRDFCRSTGEDEALCARQFCACLKSWQERTLVQLRDAGELEHRSAVAYTQILQNCQAFEEASLTLLQPLASASAPCTTGQLRPQEPDSPAPPADDSRGTALIPGGTPAPEQQPPGAQASCAARPLTPDSQSAFDEVLASLQQSVDGMTAERLLRFLRHPVTGVCSGHYSILFAEKPILAWLQLQQALPECFPDDDFALARQRLPLYLYSFQDPPAAGSEAFDDWLQESAELVRAGRAARDAMPAWQDALQALMPEQGNFRHYLQARVPHKSDLSAIPTELLDAYRQHLEEELYAQLRIFGPEKMTEDTLGCIFRDCCNALVDQWDDDYSRQRHRHYIALYTGQEFDWFDRARHSYEPGPVLFGFVSYMDAEAYTTWLNHDLGTGHKFRISIHPHDYEKAWPRVAEILYRNNCPFPLWKAVTPWDRPVGQACERLTMGGQFTLYSANVPGAQALPRFQETNIARTLKEVEDVLRAQGIRPGQRPHSDAFFGPQHPWISYRFDKDRTRNRYEDARAVDHQRRREYKDEPCFQAVCKALG